MPRAKMPSLAKAVTLVLFVVVIGDEAYGDRSTISPQLVQSKTNPADMRQARSFISQLPPACNGSYIILLTDGTVRIHVVCTSDSKSMEGIIEIKNGVVTRIK